MLENKRTMFTFLQAVYYSPWSILSSFTTFIDPMNVVTTIKLSPITSNLFMMLHIQRAFYSSGDTGVFQEFSFIWK